MVEKTFLKLIFYGGAAGHRGVAMGIVCSSRSCWWVAICNLVFLLCLFSLSWVTTPLFFLFMLFLFLYFSFFFCCLSSFSVNVYVPKDRVTNLHQGYGFVEFRSEEDADYVSSCLPSKCLGLELHAWLSFLHSCVMKAIKVLNMIRLYGKPIRVNKVSVRYSRLSLQLTFGLGFVSMNANLQIIMLSWQTALIYPPVYFYRLHKIKRA